MDLRKPPKKPTNLPVLDESIKTVDAGISRRGARTRALTLQNQHQNPAELSAIFDILAATPVHPQSSTHTYAEQSEQIQGDVSTLDIGAMGESLWSSEMII